MPPELWEDKEPVCMEMWLVIVYDLSSKDSSTVQQLSVMIIYNSKNGQF